MGEHPIGHNGGPPLDEPRHEWGEGPFGRYFEWKLAAAEAWKVPDEIAIRRARKASALGLTYAEYTLEIMERGRYLQVEDVERIRQIKARRPL
jgi:hypothetical protein